MDSEALKYAFTNWSDASFWGTASLKVGFYGRTGSQYLPNPAWFGVNI